MDLLIQDVRYALRQLMHRPQFAAIVVAVLALGIGANIAVFTLLSGILLRPLPYRNPGHIVQVQLPNDDPRFFTQPMPYADMLQLRDALGKGAQAAGEFDSSNASVAGPGGRFQLERFNVDAELLPLLGVQPVLGRAFRPDENDPGRTYEVLLSNAAWKKLFNGDPLVVGKKITIREQSYEIVGVMPRSFSFPFGDAMQIWTPAEIASTARTSMANGLSLFTAYFRMPAGMTMAQFTSILDNAQEQIAKEFPERKDFARRVKVEVYQDSLNKSALKPLLLLYSVVAGVWVLASLNATSLMLARTVARTRELAVRSALGASRARLIQQSVTESLLLSVLGGLFGLMLAQLLTKLLWHQIQDALPMTNAVQIDWRVMSGLVILTLVTALITGVVPALRASVRDPREGLTGVTATATASQKRAREALVVGQLALTLVFLVGAGLFLRTINSLRAVPLGFAARNVLTGGVILNAGPSVNLSKAEWEKLPNVVQTRYLPLLERVKAIPGVQVAALSSVLPMRAEFAVMIGANIDHQDLKPPNTPTADGRIASAGLVEAMGIPMLRGRFFDDSDTATAPPVVVINKAFSDKYFPGKDPIGHVITMGNGRSADSRIVGVIGDVKQGDVTQKTIPELYFCLAQMEPKSPLYGVTAAFMQVAIRAAVPADTLRAQFDRALHEVAPDATTTDVKTMHEVVEDSFGSETLAAHLLESLAGLALMIASVGLYGLLSFDVAQRTRELGLRIALGAQQLDVLALVLRRAVLLMALGLVSGGALAWFAVDLTKSYIFGVHAHDAATFSAVIAVLTAAGLAAALLPARRAAAVEPMKALRIE